MCNDNSTLSFSQSEGSIKRSVIKHAKSHVASVTIIKWKGGRLTLESAISRDRLELPSLIDLFKVSSKIF